MKKTKILFFAALAFSAIGLQSCLDFDTPSDEFQKNQFIVKPATVKGAADKMLPYTLCVVERTAKCLVSTLTSVSSHSAPTTMHSIQWCLTPTLCTEPSLTAIL